MTPATQVKLLRVLQERRFRRLGGRTEQTVDVRVIAATNVDPAERGAAAASCARTSTTGSTSSPSRCRRCATARRTCRCSCRRSSTSSTSATRRRCRRSTPRRCGCLEAYSWPGNVRELRNVIERATILAKGDFIEAKHLPPLAADRRAGAVVAAAGDVTLTPGMTVDEAEQQLILATLDAHRRQQDARGRDARHQPEDAAQQAQPDEAGRVSRAAAGAAGPSLIRMSIRLKQILGVTALVGAVVVALSVAHLARIARLSLEESRARGELLTNAIFHRAREVVTSRETAYAELAADAGVRSILRGADLLRRRHLRRHRRRRRGGRRAQRPSLRSGSALPPAGSLDELLARERPGAAVARSGRPRGRTLEWRAPLLLGDEALGDIRIGISTLLVRESLADTITPALATATGAAAGVGPRRDLPGAGGAAADSRHPEQPDAPRPRRARRDARSRRKPRCRTCAASSTPSARSCGALPAGGAAGARSGAAVQARHGARPAHGRRRARGEESAQRDDDSPRAAAPEAREAARRPPTCAPHADIIGHEIRRLDAVVQGFLKFARPEDMRIERVSLAALAADVAQSIRAEAEAGRVTVEATARRSRRWTWTPTRRCCARRCSTWR